MIVGINSCMNNPTLLTASGDTEALLMCFAMHRSQVIVTILSQVLALMSVKGLEEEISAFKSPSRPNCVSSKARA
jgi:hypothetical protein